MKQHLLQVAELLMLVPVFYSLTAAIQWSWHPRSEHRDALVRYFRGILRLIWILVNCMVVGAVIALVLQLHYMGQGW